LFEWQPMVAGLQLRSTGPGKTISTTMNLKDYLLVAVQAAESASREILEVYHSNDFDVKAKDDNSPLTRADRKAHERITEILKQTSLPILSEEGKSIPFVKRKQWHYFWMVDPLDGTKEFIKRNGEFTVNIALIENQAPVLGVVAVPVSGKVYYGARGFGSFVKEKNAVKSLPQKKEINLSQPRLRVVASRSHLNEETTKFIQSLHQPVLISRGSSLKFMLLAENEADIYPRFASTMEWDTAAAQAIVNQLGFKAFCEGSEEELIYNKENLLNSWFICR
jgi:3'(2'), 5'-bisphosphate nucleotidase